MVNTKWASDCEVHPELTDVWSSNRVTSSVKWWDWIMCLINLWWNGIRWYLALGFRDMQIPVTQVPSFPLSSQTRLHREVVEEERNVCVFVVSSARGSASKAKLRWAEVGILEGLLPTFIPWKSKPKCQVLPSDLARESQSKGNRRQKTPFKQVHLSYQGGRGREEQAVPTCFLFTSVLLTCWQTPPV